MKHKKLVVSGVITGVVVLAGGVAGAMYLRRPTTAVDTASLYGASSNYSASDDTNQSQAATNSLAQSAPASSQSVSSPTSSGSNQTAVSSNSNNAAAAKLLDPSTFSQYDRYKSESAAQYVDLQQGTGAALSVGQTAAVYYRGWLTNGTMFDQSRNGSDGKLQAFTFKVGDHQVIPGWEQGLVGMKAGGVRLLIVPPTVGYGANGQGPIPSNAVLIFQVQLVAVQ